MQALEYGQKLEQERLHYEELAIAQLSAAYINSQKTKPPYYSPKDLCFFAKKDAGIPAYVCNTFVNLLESQDMPSWAVAIAPVDELQSGTTEEDSESPRLWMAMGVALVAPRRTPMGLRCGMAICDGKQSGQRRVYDVDSTDFFEVIVPPIKAGAYIEVTWEEVVDAEEDD